jgi:two-component system chemotaxis response regulator CheB
MDGIEATRRIMETNPVPIVIVSGNWNPKEVETTFRAIEAGAVSLVQRPVGIGHPEHQKMAKELLQAVKLMSEIKVVKRWPRYRQKAGFALESKEASLPEKKAGIKVVAIGASTGGPVVLQTILSGLPKKFQLPVLIVQHMAKGFLHGMVDWLQQTSAIPVRIAANGERIQPGHAYFAPDGFNMGVGNRGEILLSQKESENKICPSVSFLFQSIAWVYRADAVGILLTGMGRDGAEELKLMKTKGAVTIIQDRESSVVFGMPGVALELDAATYVLSPDRIAETLVVLTGIK